MTLCAATVLRGTYSRLNVTTQCRAGPSRPGHNVREIKARQRYATHMQLNRVSRSHAALAMIAQRDFLAGARALLPLCNEFMSEAPRRSCRPAMQMRSGTLLARPCAGPCALLAGPHMVLRIYTMHQSHAAAAAPKRVRSLLQVHAGIIAKETPVPLPDAVP